MTAQTARIEYFSLKPQDTYMWRLAEESQGLKKTALIVASIVALPLELIARSFYNLGLWIYSSLCHRSVKPIEDPITIPEPIKILPQPHTSLAEAIADAQKVIPAELPPDEVTSTRKTSGTLYGQAIGDGLGLFTEFLTRTQAQLLKQAILLKKPNLAFADRPLFENRRHVANFPKDGWTDDTDQFMMIINVEKENLLD